MSLIYKSVRVGQFGKPFILFKFQTMCDGAEWMGGSSTADDDPRITRIGRILRKTKLDELPQIYNWLKGDMALIGWRPEVPAYLHTIPTEVLMTKPGILGWATLFDIDEGATLKGSKDPDKDYEEKILPMKREQELYYVRNKNWRLDIFIVFATIKKILFRS